jgi:hypothetical protein
MIQLNGKNYSQSIIAYQYLKWLEEEEGIKIQAFYSKDGERKFGPFSVDGYYEKKNKRGEIERIIVEINGCDIHGCIKCFRNDDHWLPKVRRTAGQQRLKDSKRINYLKQFVDRIIIKWPCKIRKERKRNFEMKQKFGEILASIELEKQKLK